MQSSERNGLHIRTGLFIILFAFSFAFALSRNAALPGNNCSDRHQSELSSGSINSVVCSGIDFLAFQRISNSSTECFLSIFPKINPAFGNRIIGNKIRLSHLLNISRTNSFFLIHHYHLCLSDNEDTPPLI